MRGMQVVALAAGLAPAASAAAPPADAVVAAACPGWRERQTMDCMRGYLRVDPAAAVLARGHAGTAMGLSAGWFRKLDAFAVALGGRAAVDAIVHGASWERTLHLGPELRLGAGGRRAFGYFLTRAGYSRRLTGARSPWSTAGDPLAGGADTFHYGVGAGAWGRLGRRFLLGAEASLDVVQWRGRGALPVLSLALTLGAWL